MTVLRRRAFTLVELLIVIAIIGILSALLIPRMGTATQDARETGVERQLQVLRGQLEAYRNREGAYPTSVTTGTDWSDMTDRSYLVVPPMNPLRQNATTIAAGASIAVGAAVPGNAAWYWDTTEERLYAAGEDGTRLDL